MRTPRLDNRLRFFRRAETHDGAGNTEGAWVQQFELWAEMKSRPGSEVFLAARFEGRVPYQVLVRQTPQALMIETGWMARDMRGIDYDVQAPQIDLLHRAFLSMVLVAGGRIG